MLLKGGSVGRGKEGLGRWVSHAHAGERPAMSGGATAAARGSCQHLRGSFRSWQSTPCCPRGRASWWPRLQGRQGTEEGEGHGQGWQHEE